MESSENSQTTENEGEEECEMEFKKLYGHSREFLTRIIGEYRKSLVLPQFTDFAEELYEKKETQKTSRDRSWISGYCFEYEVSFFHIIETLYKILRGFTFIENPKENRYPLPEEEDPMILCGIAELYTFFWNSVKKEINAEIFFDHENHETLKLFEDLKVMKVDDLISSLTDDAKTQISPYSIDEFGNEFAITQENDKYVTLNWYQNSLPKVEEYVEGKPLSLSDLFCLLRLSENQQFLLKKRIHCCSLLANRIDCDEENPSFNDFVRTVPPEDDEKYEEKKKLGFYYYRTLAYSFFKKLGLFEEYIVIGHEKSTDSECSPVFLKDVSNWTLLCDLLFRKVFNLSKWFNVDLDLKDEIDFDEVHMEYIRSFDEERFKFRDNHLIYLTKAFSYVDGEVFEKKFGKIESKNENFSRFCSFSKEWKKKIEKGGNVFVNFDENNYKNLYFENPFTFLKHPRAELLFYRLMEEKRILKLKKKEINENVEKLKVDPFYGDSDDSEGEVEGEGEGEEMEKVEKEKLDKSVQYERIEKKTCIECEHCKKSFEKNKMKACGKCKTAFFCSGECFTLNWKKIHRKVCGKEKKCGNCKSSSKKLKLCVCKKVYFCSFECQKENWKVHSSKCTGRKLK